MKPKQPTKLKENADSTDRSAKCREDKAIRQFELIRLHRPLPWMRKSANVARIKQEQFDQIAGNATLSSYHKR